MCMSMSMSTSSKARLTGWRTTITWSKGLQPVGPDHRPEGHLIGTLLISEVPHHVEAFEVEERHGCQELVLDEQNYTNFSDLSNIVQGTMQTVTIAGHQYVILVTPFQD